MTYHLVALGCLTVSGAYMSWSDLVRRRLPNLANVALALTGLAAVLVLVGVNQTVSHLLHAVIALCCGFLVCAVGLAGSGDAKYYAAVAAWFPLTESPRLLGWMSLIGFLLALIWLVTSPLDQQELDPSGDFSKVPFGIAIAAAALLTITGLLP